MLYAQQTGVVNSLMDQLALAQGLQASYWATYQQAELIYADSGCGG